MVRSPRKEREINHIKEDVLHAAARAIARQGLEATTIHDIAREAGYTAQTLYAYFKGKQEIIDSLVVLMDKEWMDTFEDHAPPGMTFRQRLELLLRRQANFIAHWREAFIVFFAAKALSDPVLTALSQGRVRIQDDPYQQRLTEWIKEAAKPGEISGYDPEDVALFHRGITSAFFFKGILKDHKDHLSDEIGMILDLFFGGIGSGRVEKGSKPRTRRAQARHAGA